MLVEAEFLLFLKYSNKHVDEGKSRVWGFPFPSLESIDK